MSAHMEGWKRADNWRKRGRNFLVEVYHHTSTPSTLARFDDDCDGPHHWAVYAYLYPEHPHFAAFSDGNGALWQPATEVLNLHGACSYLSRYRDSDATVLSVKVGCDYDHLGDSRFASTEPEHAGRVFADALKLFNQLQAMEATGSAS